ncbi:MAG: ATP-binding protein [Bacteroidales bacterium]
MVRIQRLGIVMAWTLLLLASGIWDGVSLCRNHRELALNKARSIFGQIVIMRRWNTSYNGVYVPVTDQSQPNPYLKDPWRDLRIDTLELTKINPAYMTRQMSELQEDDLHFHITSLDPLRPENRADAWESDALTYFHQGGKERYEETGFRGCTQFRYMAPLYTEERCLRCHDPAIKQVGKVHGGISVSFPVDFYAGLTRRGILRSVLLHLLVWLTGLTVYFALNRRLLKSRATIERNRQEYLKASHSKDKLFSIVAHDLRSPLASALQMSRLLQKDEGELDQEHLNLYSRAVHDTIQQTDNLLTNLLNWTSAQLDRLKFEPRPLRLKAVCEDVVGNIWAFIHNKNIEVDCQVPEDFPVVADENMLKLILRNLIINAVKFSRPDTVIRISAHREDQKVHIAVADQGEGMDEATLDRLFGAGAASSTPGTNQEQGTGLGLKICREFVERHGGDIRAESQPGKGSTFHIRLPDRA